MLYFCLEVAYFQIAKEATGSFINYIRQGNDAIMRKVIENE